jgi:hypothetical protein
MEGGSGGINAGVDADLFRLEDFVEDIAVAILRVSLAVMIQELYMLLLTQLSP